MRSLFLRLVKIALALMVIGFVGIILLNSIVAYTAREIPLDPETRVIVEQAKAEYLRQVPLSFTTIRLVVTSVEKCGRGKYLVLFDDYRWFGRIKGHATYTDSKGVGWGGTTSNKEELEEIYRIYWWGEVVKLPLGALPLALLRITAISSVALITVTLFVVRRGWAIVLS